MVSVKHMGPGNWSETTANVIPDADIMSRNSSAVKTIFNRENKMYIFLRYAGKIVEYCSHL